MRPVLTMPEVHQRSLRTSTALSVYYMPELITPLQVIRLLNEKKIKFVLMGAHAMGGWMDEPRATQDVDVLVASRSVRKAVRELLAAFPQLEAVEHEVVTRLNDKISKKCLIDVMKPHQQIFAEALNNTCAAELDGEKYLIPSLEMALALKFAPMVSLTRSQEKKFIDAHDFILMIKVNPDIDLDELERLGELVYAGGGAELVAMVGQVQRGEQLTL